MREVDAVPVPTRATNDAPIDAEVQAIRTAFLALEQLNDAGRMRAFRYLASRLNIMFGNGMY